MVSDEKRREVAEKMREYDVAEFKESAIVPFIECLGHGYKDWRGILDELADLIDRPTCEVLYYEQESSNKMAKPCEAADADFVQCGNCENWMQWVWDYENHNWCAPKYCSCCGAEVVRDGD